MRKLLILAIVLLLFTAACDRFEHNFKPGDDIDPLPVELLPEAFMAITPNNMEPLAGLYHEDYLHNGVNKSERMAWIAGFMLDNPNVAFQISDPAQQILDENHAVISWRLKVLNGEIILADSLFVGENVVRENESWLIEGNKVCTGANTQQMVIAEYFTSRSCPNCPPAEAKLQALQAQYPQNFIYLEHHVSMELAIPGETTHMYYQAWSQPSAVFQGTEKVVGSADNALSEYQAIVDALVLVEKPITYEIKNVDQVGNTLSAEVKLNPQIQLDQSDLVLNYVLISDEHEYTNYAGQPLHNVVRAKGSMSLAEVDLQEDLPLSLSLDGSFPAEYTLVVFAQKKPATFQNDSTIYGGAQWTNVIPTRSN